MPSIKIDFTTSIQSGHEPFYLTNDKHSEQVIQYLEELAKALTELSVTSPFHIVITGGAYMLLHKKRRFTLDIDFAIIESPRRARPKKVFRTTIQRIEISRRTSTVPFAAEFKQTVGMVAQRHRDLLDDEYEYEGRQGRRKTAELRSG